VTGTAAIPRPAVTRPTIASGLGVVLLAIAVVFTAGEMLRRTEAHRFEQSDPSLALAWEPADVTARENLANRRLAAAIANRSSTARSVGLSSTRAVAIRALAEGPLHWAALRDLGIAEDMAGNKVPARSVMARAALRGFRDVPTQAWWFQQAIVAGDALAGLPRLDALLRSEPDLEPRLFPIIPALLTRPAVGSALSARLSANPPWRDAVLSDLAAKGPDTAAVGGLFLDLRSRSASPDDHEFGVLLTRIAAAGRYDDARALWKGLVGLTPSQAAAAPYDGAFRGAPGMPPFNWHIYPLESGAAQMEAMPGTGFALTMSYPASAKPTIAEQLLMLTPGAYHLAGRWRVTGAAPGAGVSWTLNCAADGAAVGEWRHDVDTQTAWSIFDVGFVVPSGCTAQWLRLSGQAGTGFGDVGAAFTGLSIHPAAPAAAPPK